MRLNTNPRSEKIKTLGVLPKTGMCCFFVVCIRRVVGGLKRTQISFKTDLNCVRVHALDNLGSNFIKLLGPAPPNLSHTQTYQHSDTHTQKKTHPHIQTHVLHYRSVTSRTRNASHVSPLTSMPHI